MQLRILFSLVNIGVFLTLFALEFLDPAYATLIFYLLLGWFIGSIVLLRASFMNRRIGGTPTPAATPGGPAPLPSAGTPLPRGVDGAEIGFCPHCGTHIAPGTAVCPACGRATRIG